jgi:hypothetical protein
MKAIGGFLKNKQVVRSENLDKESVFYVFKNIIRIKFGEVGVLNIKLDFYKKGIIYLKISNSNWANEIWLNKQMLIEELNKKIGDNEIKDIKLK